jgi:CCR4-NOT transcription complex subunit 9
MTVLLQEVISVYPLLMPGNLSAQASNRVCNALALLQCIASHNETRALFLNGVYPLAHLSFLGRCSSNITCFALLFSPNTTFPLPVSYYNKQAPRF